MLKYLEFNRILIVVTRSDSFMCVYYVRYRAIYRWILLLLLLLNIISYMLFVFMYNQ